MEEDEYNDIVTYIQDQKKILWILLKHCNCNDLYIYLKNTAIIKKYFTSTYLFAAMLIN